MSPFRHDGGAFADNRPYFAFGVSQSLIFLSAPPDASTSPATLNARQITVPACAVKLADSLPLVTSQNLIVPFSSPDANVLPSGLKVKDATFACPLRVDRALPVATSHSVMVV